MKLTMAQRLTAAGLAFVLLAAGECGGLSFSDIVTGHSAEITAKNNAGEPIILILYADDASNVGPVIPRGENTITTHIDGIYNVIVLPASGGAPRTLATTLNALRVATQDLFKAKAGNAEADTASATNRITEANGQLEVVRHAELALASCTGLVKFPSELAASPKPITVAASVTKTDEGWAAACPSS